MSSRSLVGLAISASMLDSFAASGALGTLAEGLGLEDGLASGEEVGGALGDVGAPMDIE